MPIVATAFQELFEDVPPPVLLIAAAYGLHMLGGATRQTRAFMMLYVAIIAAVVAGGVVALELHEWAHAEADDPEEVEMAEVTELIDDDVDAVD